MAVFSGRSSCMKCPASGKTWRAYLPEIVLRDQDTLRQIDGTEGLPCICPIVNSVSSLSVPANNSILPPLPLKNFPLNPRNQPSQKGCVLAKSVLHVHSFCLLAPLSALPSPCAALLLPLLLPATLLFLTSNPGTLTLALIPFLSVLERTCHSIASLTESNPVGRVAKYACMLCSASIADPSTTSSTTYPSRSIACCFSRGSEGISSAATCVTTAPPRECPTKMMGGREGQCIWRWVRKRTERRSWARVARERSCLAVSSWGCGVVGSDDDDEGKEEVSP